MGDNISSGITILEGYKDLACTRFFFWEQLRILRLWLNFFRHKNQNCCNNVSILDDSILKLNLEIIQ